MDKRSLRKSKNLPEGWIIEPHRTLDRRLVSKNKGLRVHAIPDEIRNGLDHYRVVHEADLARAYARSIDADVAENGTVVVSHAFYARVIYLKESKKMIVLGEMKTEGPEKTPSATCQALDEEIVDGFYRETMPSTRGSLKGPWPQLT